jgi:hypothetical protein
MTELVDKHATCMNALSRERFNTHVAELMSQIGDLQAENTQGLMTLFGFKSTTKKVRTRGGGLR